MKLHKNFEDYCPYPDLSTEDGKLVMCVNLGKAKRVSDAHMNKHIDNISKMLWDSNKQLWEQKYKVLAAYEDWRGDLIIETTYPAKKYDKDLWGEF